MFRKRIFILILIVIILILFGNFYPKFKEKSSTKNLNIASISDRNKYELFNEGKIPAPKTPQLYIDGPFIKRSDTNEPVQLKGVTSMAFVYYDYETEDLIYKLETLKKWGINLLGLFLNYDNVKNKYDQLDEVINWAENNGIYVYLMPAINNKDKNKTTLKQIEDFPELIYYLVEKYKNKNHILYGLWAEPRQFAWDDWSKIATDNTIKIRELNPKSIILMTGVSWGRYIFSDEYPFDFSNVIYDYHDYPFTDIQEAKKYNNINPRGIIWQEYIGKKPILIGEFGGVYKEDFGSKEDINYVKVVLENINNNKLHYSAYTIDDQGELGLMDWNKMNPTRKGELIKKDLEQFPPTFID